MKFDTKQKILVAIYIEYQKDVPNMKDNIRYDVLEIEKPVFDIALKKLQNENLITGATFIEKGSYIQTAWSDTIMMTRDGIEYVETKVGLSHVLTGKEKVKYILENAAVWGLDQIKDVAARTLSELSKPQ